MVNELRGSLRIDNKQIELKNLRITGNNIQLIAEGNISGYQLYEPTVNLKLSSSKLQIQRLLGLLPSTAPIPLTGTAKLTAEIHGELSNLTGSGEVLISEGKYRNIPFTGFLTSFTATTGAIKLVQGNLNIFNGKLTAHGDLALASGILHRPDIPLAADTGANTKNIDTSGSRGQQAGTNPIKNNVSLNPKSQIPNRTEKPTGAQTGDKNFSAPSPPRPFVDSKFNLAITAEHIAVDKFPNAANLVAGTVSGDIQVAGILNNPETWSGASKIQWTNGTYKSVPITGANSMVAIEKGMVTIQKLQVENQDTLATGTGSIRLKTGEAHLQFSLTARRMDSLNRLFFNTEETGTKPAESRRLAGAGTAEIALDGPLRNPRWSGKFSVSDGSFSLFRFGLLHGQIFPPPPDSKLAESNFIFHWENLQWGEGWNLNGDANLRFNSQQKKALITSASFMSGKSQIAGSGELDFVAKRMQLSFSGNKLNLSDFPQLKKAIPHLTAELDLEGTISGLFSSPVVSGRLATSSLTADKLRLPKLAGTFNYTATAKQTQFDVSGGGYLVQGTIQLAIPEPNLQIQITAQSGDMKLVTAGFGIPNSIESGTIIGTGTVSGKISNLTIIGNFQQVEIFTPESVNKISLANGTYSGKITGKTGYLQVAAGTLRILNLGKEKNINSPASNRNGAEPASDYSLLGLDAIKADLNWNESARVSGNITATHGTITSIPLTNFVTSSNFESGNLTITNCSFATGNGTMTLSGAVYWTPKPFTYHFTAKALNIQLQPILRSIQGLDQFKNSSGLLNAELTFNGEGTQVDALAGKGNLTLTQLSFLERNIDSFSANIEITNEVLKVTSAELRRNHTTASLSGWIDKNQKLNITAKGYTDNLKLWLPQAKGAAQFQLNWTNTLQKPVLTCYLESTSGGYTRIAWDKAQATIKLTDKLLGTVEFSGERILLGTQRFDLATAHIQLNDPNIELTQFTAIQKEGTSQALGKLNLNTGEITITTDGKKLDFMNLLFGGTQAPWWETGEVNLHAEFNGNYKQHTAITKINPLQVVSKQKINGTPKYTLRNQQEIIINWNHDRITVPKIIVTDGTGSFTIDGNIQLTSDYHIKYYDMALQGNNVSWPVLRGLQATYNPQLTLRGDTTAVKWSGNFPITKAEINGPILFAPPPSNIPKLAVVKPLSSPVELDLMFRAEEKLHLKTPMVDVDGKGWIKLEGLANEPKISYEFQAVSGFVQFRGYRFQITKADAKPRESNSFNPIMDLYAQKKIRLTDVYLRFSGTLQNYDITLTSDPPLEQSDIMALLATGKTTEELRTATAAGSERFAYGLAAGYVGEELMNTLGGPIVKTVGIDRVGVDYENTNNPNEPRLKIEKDINKRVTASYSMGLTKYADPQAKLELELGKNLSLVGSVGTNSLTQAATGAVDLELKFRTK